MVTRAEISLLTPYCIDGLANAFFGSGSVESWGRGISKMTELCVAEGLPAVIPK